MAAAFRRGCGVSWVRAGIGRVGALLRGRRKGGSLRASTRAADPCEQDLWTCFALSQEGADSFLGYPPFPNLVGTRCQNRVLAEGTCRKLSLQSHPGRHQTVLVCSFGCKQVSRPRQAGPGCAQPRASPN